MFKSIKSKIVGVSISLLFVLALVVISSAVIAFYRDKEQIIAANNVSITSFEGQMNAEIAELEKNALDLALMGEIYYQKGKQQDVGEFFAKGILHNYPNSMGNGIYFLPYQISNDQKIFCIHAVWGDNGKIELLPSCVKAIFDYFGQNWYSEILKNIDRKKRVSWVRPYRSTQLGNLMTTVGAGIYNQGNLVGMATVDWEMDTILKSILKIKPTKGSFVLFADKTNDCIIATTEPGVDNNTIMGKSLKETKWYSDKLKEGEAFDYKGKKYIPYIKRLNNGFFLIVNVPQWELFQKAVKHLRNLLTVLLISALVIVGILYRVLRRNINQPIAELTDIAKKISGGDLDRTIHLAEPSELAQLAGAFNKMKTDIKTHLLELARVSGEKEKIESELAIAHTIQTSALPTDFPKNERFELVASMTPAREVGGDFYDFFPVGEGYYAFVMADVSGKGITAALYMMSAKAMIKNMLQAGYPIAEAINKANKGLCDNHVRGMFVTAFIGILDVKTGEIQYVNAGHCPPLQLTKKGYDYVTVVRNLVLGITPNYQYESGKFKLKNGERLFLYTDGVTEAQTDKEKLFGPERLQKALNQKIVSPEGTIAVVRKAIQRFVKGAAQSDDITMMVLAFHRAKK
ncbi:MAG: SpoIIE family protein phosphatase [Alphaproteobacteria bacterium]|nr:SpoIIE family protein phosphatase [Alphaproteobacteria bacterium]